MMRWILPGAILMLAACGGGDRDSEQAAPGAEPAVPDMVAPVAEGSADTPGADSIDDADLDYVVDPSMLPPVAADPGIGAGNKMIPMPIRGRWALDVADCEKAKGLTVLDIDAATLRFFESAGELMRVRDRSASRIVADYRFSGEGENWDRLMLLGLADGGTTLVRRDYGEGAEPDLLRYTRCAASAA